MFVSFNDTGILCLELSSHGRKSAAEPRRAADSWPDPFHVTSCLGSCQLFPPAPAIPGLLPSTDAFNIITLIWFSQAVSALGICIRFTWLPMIGISSSKILWSEQLSWPIQSPVFLSLAGGFTPRVTGAEGVVPGRGWQITVFLSQPPVSPLFHRLYAYNWFWEGEIQRLGS